jgi:thermitase
MPAPPPPLTAPTFEGFTIRIAPTDGAAKVGAARKALTAALRPLGATAKGWVVRKVHPSRPGVFDLLPPRDLPLTVAQAWDVTYRLLAVKRVTDAEPSFEVFPDRADLYESPPSDDEDVASGSGGPGLSAAAGLADVMAAPAGGPPVFSKHDCDWCPRLILADLAWAVPPRNGGFPPGKAKGEGIRVGHPDSGYRRHAEIFDGGQPVRFLAQQGFDFVDDDLSAEDAAGGHGLGTASVVMSSEAPLGTRFVTGVAPAAAIVPFRVAKPHPVLPVPVILRSGMLRLADAIYRAVDTGCHVISISLGWLPNEKAHEAVRYAVEKDVIVVAAAGNAVRVFVVWPAHYDEVVSCAGCTSHRRRWSGSSRGRRVDVTAPAEHVWKAAIDDEGIETVVPSDGTSFSAASVAGVAALWLAYWGRDRLLSTYGGEFRLANVFRRLLMDSCDPPPEGHDGNFGAGIVNAKRLLETDLPTREELRASSAPIFESVLFHTAESTAVSGLRSLAEAFDELPRDVLLARLDAVLNEAPVEGVLPPSEARIADQVDGVGRELVFQILTDPSLREAMLATSASAPPASGLEAPLEAPGPARLRSAPLSSRLRSRVQ